MACKPVQKLCPNLRISQGVTYASGVLTVNIPAGDYQNGCVYGIVIARRTGSKHNRRRNGNVSAAEMQRRTGDSV